MKRHKLVIRSLLVFTLGLGLASLAVGCDEEDQQSDFERQAGEAADSAGRTMNEAGDAAREGAKKMGRKADEGKRELGKKMEQAGKEMQDN